MKKMAEVRGELSALLKPRQPLLCSADLQNLLVGLSNYL